MNKRTFNSGSTRLFGSSERDLFICSDCLELGGLQSGGSHHMMLADRVADGHVPYVQSV